MAREDPSLDGFPLTRARRLPGVLVAVEFEGPARPWDSTWYRRPVLSRWCTRSSKKNCERSRVRTYHCPSRFFFAAPSSIYSIYFICSGRRVAKSRNPPAAAILSLSLTFRALLPPATSTKLPFYCATPIITLLHCR